MDTDRIFKRKIYDRLTFRVQKTTVTDDTTTADFTKPSRTRTPICTHEIFKNYTVICH